MQYGICPLSTVPFGEHFKILESRKYWSRIRVAFDKTEGWILNRQMAFITDEEYIQIDKSVHRYTSDLISYVENGNQLLIPIVLGSSINNSKTLAIKFEGNAVQSKQLKADLIKTALLYLNSPELHGGKTPFGIDASGFTQMVYRINGYCLLRTAEAQATQGDALSFVEESEAGDLAFFDNSNGVIDHVGIIMDNNYVIHVNGMVRIDRLDHTGIFNNDLRNYTHKLRVIKKII